MTLPDGGEIHDPVRVVPNGAGSLLTSRSVRRRAGRTARRAADAALVMADLERLRALLESAEPSIHRSRDRRTKRCTLGWT